MSVLSSIRSLINTMEEENCRLTRKIDFFTKQLIICRKSLYNNINALFSSPKHFYGHGKNHCRIFHLNNERLKLENQQKTIRSYINMFSKIIESDDIQFDNFPIFMDIELAERLTDIGLIEKKKNESRCLSVI